MQEYYERLEVTADVTPADLKAAYHKKLRQFPAHSHPQEFKAIRAAYEAIRKGESAIDEDYFQVRPLDIELDKMLLQQLHQRVIAQTEVSLEELLRLTF
jgi:hypothetical protein